MVLDGTGSFINREEYRPYGETSFGSYERKRYRYSGKERDGESSLYYHGARYYAPWLARWTSPDPARMVDGVNLYEYVKGNPVRLRDPDGMESEEGEESVRSETILGLSPQEVIQHEEEIAEDEFPIEIGETLIDQLMQLRWDEARGHDIHLHLTPVAEGWAGGYHRVEDEILFSHDRFQQALLATWFGIPDWFPTRTKKHERFHAFQYDILLERFAEDLGIEPDAPRGEQIEDLRASLAEQLSLEEWIAFDLAIHAGAEKFGRLAQQERSLLRGDSLGGIEEIAKNETADWLMTNLDGYLELARDEYLELTTPDDETDIRQRTMAFGFHIDRQEESLREHGAIQALESALQEVGSSIGLPASKELHFLYEPSYYPFQSMYTPVRPFP